MLTMSIVGQIQLRYLKFLFNIDVPFDNTKLAFFKGTPFFLGKQTWMCCYGRLELLHEGFFQRLRVRLESTIMLACRFVNRELGCGCIPASSWRMPF